MYIINVIYKYLYMLINWMFIVVYTYQMNILKYLSLPIKHKTAQAAQVREI